MPRPFTPKVIAANALVEGDPVWLTEDDDWTRDIREAELIEDEAHGQLRLLYAEAQADRVVGPYLAEARREVGQVVPAHVREACRVSGPTILEGSAKRSHLGLRNAGVRKT